jgi:hypothetical protein
MRHSSPENRVAPRSGRIATVFYVIVATNIADDMAPHKPRPAAAEKLHKARRRDRG